MRTIGRQFISVLILGLVLAGAASGLEVASVAEAASSAPIVETSGNTNPGSWTVSQNFASSNASAASSGKHYCGGDSTKVETAIDFGCKGKGNAMTDMAFAIIRFLSDGVGIVVIASIIVGGVQYSASGGDPNAAQAAMKRIRSSVGALILFIFAYAILNYVLPAGFLK